MSLNQQYPHAQHHLLKLPLGADLHAFIEDYCEQHHIEIAWISALGALSEVELAFYNQVTHQYQTQVFTGEFEILNATGNISLKNDKPFAHIHITLSGDDFKAFGGHVMPKSTKVFACEVHLTALTGNTALYRDSQDEQTGLYLWSNCKV